MNKLFKLAKENDIEIEVFTNKVSECNIEVLNDCLNNFNVEHRTSYKIKAICEGKTINISTETLKNPEEIISVIKKNASIIDNTNSNKLCENDYVSSARKKSEKIDYSKIKEDLLSLNNLRDKYKFIVNVNSIVGYKETIVAIDNDKHHLSDASDYFSMAVLVSGKKDDVVKTKTVCFYSAEYDFSEIVKEVEEKIKELELEFSATSIKTNKYKVLLTNEATNSIISATSDLYDAKSIYLKVSLLSDKLNKKIYSDKITILEEPVNEKFILNRHFDNEGTLTYNKEIVKDGVFKQSTNNIEYALKTHTKPTGNASGLFNLHIKEGTKSYDELVKLLDNGIIINDVVGLHSGINHTTGDISLQAQGLLVKKGKVVKALNMIILSTNILELLSNVIAVGSDLKEFSSKSSSPSLLLDNITISGSEE